jgi:fructose/tagatose bisphosphate aldolase
MFPTELMHKGKACDVWAFTIGISHGVALEELASLKFSFKAFKLVDGGICRYIIVHGGSQWNLCIASCMRRNSPQWGYS